MIDEQFFERIIVYAGRRESNGGETFYSYYILPTNAKEFEAVEINEAASNSTSFGKKLFDKDFIGSCHSAKINKDGRIKYNSKAIPKYFKIDQKLLAEWKALDISFDKTKELKKDATVRNGMGELLQPIRKAYKYSDAKGKAQIMAEVIRILIS